MLKADFSTARGIDNKATSRPRRWLRRAFIAATILICVFALTVLGLRLYFNSAWFKTRIETALKDALNRNAEVSSVDISFWRGNIILQGLRVSNALSNFQDADTLRCENIAAEIALWPALFSNFAKIENLKIELQRPQLIIERQGFYPRQITNIDDLLRKFFAGPPSAWPKATGLRALNAQLIIHDGIVSFTDESSKFGTSRLEKIEFSAQINDLGQPLEMKFQASLATPNSDTVDEASRFAFTSRDGSSTPGCMSADARIIWIDADGNINPDAFKDIHVQFVLNNADLPYLARCVGVQGDLANGRYQWTPGKPLTGAIALDAPSLSAINFSVKLDSDSVLSIYKDGKNIAGNVPGHVEFQAEFGVKNRTFREGPFNGSLLLAASSSDLVDAQKPKLLNLQVSASAPANKSRAYSITLKTLDELFSTDIAAALELKGKFGGAMSGKAEALIVDDGPIKTSGQFDFNSYITVDTASRRVEDTKRDASSTVMDTITQRSSATINFKADFARDPQGRLDCATLSFLAKGASFEIGASKPIQISSLADISKLTADAHLKLSLRGREFWSEFNPVLTLAGLSAPLNEVLDGELIVKGSRGELTADWRGTLTQQTQAPSPIRLNIAGVYDGAAMSTEKPCLRFDIGLQSVNDKTISLKMLLNLTQNQNHRVWDAPEYHLTADLAALNHLNRRFGAYLQIFIGDAYAVQGDIRQNGKSTFIEDFNLSGRVVATHLTHNADMQLSRFSLKGPNPFQPGATLTWQENEPISLQFALAVNSDAKTTTLAIKPFALKSNLISLSGELSETDLTKLQVAAVAQPKRLQLWLDALSDLRLDIKRLQFAPKYIAATLKAAGYRYAWLDLMLTDVYHTGGNLWTLSNAGLRSSGTAGTVDLWFDASTPLRVCSGPATSNRVLLHEIDGHWRVDSTAPLRINLNSDRLSARGALIFDQTKLLSTAANPWFIYRKAIGEPCKLEFAVSQDAEGALRLLATKLIGGPLNLAAINLVYRALPSPLLTLDKLTLGEGAQAITLANLFLDQAKDQFRVNIAAPKVNLTDMARYLALGPKFKIMGECQANLMYDGSLRALISETPFSAADKFALDIIAANNARLEGDTPEASAYLNLVGNFHADNLRFTAKNVNLGVDYRPKNGVAGQSHILMTAEAVSKAPNGLLLNALKSPGLPINVKAKIASDSTINLNVLDVVSVLLDAAAPKPTPTAPNDLSGIRHLRFETDINTPTFVATGMTIQKVEISNLTLDELILSIAHGKCAAFGGEIAMSDARYSLTGAASARLKNFKVADIDLEAAQAVLAPPASSEYHLSGRVSGGGSFESQNFNPVNSSTWNGDFKVVATNLMATKRANKNADIDWVKLGAGVLGAAGSRVARLYSDDFGLFLNKLEFEPLEIALKINRGQIALSQTSVSGKAGTRSAGLRLEIEGGVSIPKKAFIPQLAIRIIKLPPRAQEQLDFNKLTEAERQAILTRFEQRQFEPPIILTGKTSAPSSNWIQVALAFSKLDQEIEQLLQAKNAPSTSSGAANDNGKNKIKDVVKDKIKEQLGNWLDQLDL